jgi:hypothetical protein
LVDRAIAHCNARFANGDAWHPIRVRVDWLRDTGLPRLREIAATEGRKVPALCPRIMLDLREYAVPEAERVAGQGSLEQVRGDLRALSELGADYVVLDTYSGKPEDTKSLDHHWAMLTRIKSKA